MATPLSAPRVAGDQFFVTHCSTEDSVLGSPGYSVRAAPGHCDREALLLALEYPPYELPLDMWADKSAKDYAPCRLARTPHPRVGVWVAHSVYLPEDSMGRDRSYFSHLIHLPALVTAAAALQSWGAAGWVTQYPPRAAQSLPRVTLPVGDVLSPTALATFFRRTPEQGTAGSRTGLPPNSRSRHFANPRGELVGRVIKGLLLAKANGGPRDRLFVHAKSSLVAMLLYATAQIMPPAFTADLTFSTFEPPHRGLRDYKLATVVGTYSGSETVGLEDDLATTHGYVLDALHPKRSSPELRKSIGLPPGAAALLELALAGEWSLLGEVRQTLASWDSSFDAVDEAIGLARAMRQHQPGPRATPAGGLDDYGFPIPPTAKPLVPLAVPNPRPPQQASPSGGLKLPVSPPLSPERRPPPAARRTPPSKSATPGVGTTAGGSETCPTCGRVNSGRPGARYCVICERSY